MTDSDASVRGAAAIAWARLDAEAAVLEILAAIETESDVAARQAMIQALGITDQAIAHDNLKHMANDALYGRMLLGDRDKPIDSSARATALIALARSGLGGHSIHEDIVRRPHAVHADVHFAACLGLGMIALAREDQSKPGFDAAQLAALLPRHDVADASRAILLIILARHGGDDDRIAAHAEQFLKSRRPVLARAGAVSLPILGHKFVRRNRSNLWNRAKDQTDILAAGLALRALATDADDANFEGILAMLEGPRAVRPFAALAAVRASGAATVGRRVRVARRLRACLDDAGPSELQAACLGLGLLMDVDSREFLGRLVEVGRSRGTRSAAAFGLGMLGATLPEDVRRGLIDPGKDGGAVSDGALALLFDRKVGLVNDLCHALRRHDDRGDLDGIGRAMAFAERGESIESILSLIDDAAAPPSARAQGLLALGRTDRDDDSAVAELMLPWSSDWFDGLLGRF